MRAADRVPGLFASPISIRTVPSGAGADDGEDLRCAAPLWPSTNLICNLPIAGANLGIIHLARCSGFPEPLTVRVTRGVAASFERIVRWPSTL